MLISIIISTICIVLAGTTDAFAWGPATHMEYAHHALAALSMLPPALRNLLKKHKDHFLYGSVAADITLGKDYRGYMYNCHNWNVGMNILDKKAKADSQKAFMYGFLGHLAVDTVSHNFFVPFKMMRSWNTRLLKHVYWEMRMDGTIDSKYWAELQKFSENPFEEDDKLLQGHLKEMVFSFKTNKLIFNGLLRLQQMKQYQNKLRALDTESKWALDPKDVVLYKKLAKGALIDFLKKFEKSYCLQADPTGKLKQSYAREVASQLQERHSAGKLTPAKEKKFLKKAKQCLQEGIYDFVELPQVKDFF